MKKQRWTPKAVGNDAEKLVDEIAHAAGLQWSSESVVDSAKRRSKGGVDRVYHLSGGRKLYAEIKFSKDGRYTYKANSEAHDIKWTQIGILNKAHMDGHEAGFIFVTPDRTPVFVRISDFMRRYTETMVSHIKFAEAEAIGVKMDDMAWCKEDLCV